MSHNVSKAIMPLNVKDFGAKGDGINDDTTPFLNAIAVANGRDIYVPNGDYRVALTLTDEPVCMYGNGRLLQRLGSSVIDVTRSNGNARLCSISDVRYGQYQTPADQNTGDFTSIISLSGSFTDIENGDNLFITSEDYYAFEAFLDGNKTYQAAWAKVHGIGITVGSLVGQAIQEDVVIIGTTTGASGLVTTSSNQQDGTYRIIFSKVPNNMFQNGETLQVSGSNVGVVSGAPYIVLCGRTLDAYTNNVKFYKPTTSLFKLSGLRFSAEGDTDAVVGQNNRKPAIELSKVQGADIDVHVEDSYGSAIMLYTSFNCRVRAKVDKLPCNDSDGAYGYGAAVFGASDYNDFQIIATNCRHAFTTLTTAHVSPIWINANTTGTPKFNTVHDSISHNSIADGFDTHAGAYFTSFINCQSLNNFSGRRTVSESNGFKNRAIGTRFISCYARNCLTGFVENSAEYGNMPFASTVVFERCTADGFIKDGFFRGNYTGNRAVVLYDGCLADGKWGTDIAEDPRRPSVHLHCGWRTWHAGNIKYVNCSVIGVAHFPWRDEGAGCKTEWRDCSVDMSRSPSYFEAMSAISVVNVPTSYYISGLSIRKHPYVETSIKSVLRLSGANSGNTPVYIDEVRWIGGGPRPLMSKDAEVIRTLNFSKMPRAFNPKSVIVACQGISALSYADTTVFVTGVSGHTINLPKAYETQIPVRIINQSTGDITINEYSGSSDNVNPSLIGAGSWCEFIPYENEWQGVSSTGYTLPVASNSVLGGIKIGSGLSIDGNGVVSSTATSSSSTVVSSGGYGGSNARVIYDWNDFLGGSNSGAITTTIYTFTNANGGGFSFNTAGKVATAVGIGVISTNTLSAGFGTLNAGNSCIDIGEGAIQFTSRITLPIASDDVDTYTSRIGLNDSTSSAEPGDGAYFRYAHNVSGGNWQCVTRSNNSETASDSGLASGIGVSTFTKLKIVTDPTIPNVKFYIDDSLRATHTTNIPSGTARATGIVPASISKSLGTANRQIFVDYAEFIQTLTTSR